MQRCEVWFAEAPGGDRPVLVLTLDPVADRIDYLVVANFDNIHTLPRGAFRRRIVQLEAGRLGQACGVLRDAVGC